MPSLLYRLRGGVHRPAGSKAPHPAQGKHRAGWWPDEHARPPEPDPAELDPAAVRPAGLHRGSDPQWREPDRQG